MNYPVTLTVNGREYSRDVEARTLLADLLRDDLGLTGTRIGCDGSACGACTVILDGKAVKACTRLAVQADGSSVLTIEGLARGGRLHPIQEAFRERHALHCGFCTPGMVLAAKELLERTPDPSEDEIRRGLDGHLCRCTGYQNIVEAVKQAGAALRAGPEAS